MTKTRHDNNVTNHIGLLYVECETELVKIEPLKVRHNVTKLDLTILFLSFWCIDIDLII